MTARGKRRALTLFEILVVLMILVISAALAYYSLNAMSPYYKVNAGMDSVRAAWAQARARAIEQGRPYRFSVEPNGPFFRVAPDRDDYWNGGTPSDDPEGKGYVHEEALPGGVAFVINGDPTGAPPAARGNDADRRPSGRWNTTCVFQADGTAREDVRIVFQMAGTKPMQLYLRGLTGATSVTTLR
jgi:prepilin-type N-terminal cleavage/methylation domain-containing protein